MSFNKYTLKLQIDTIDTLPISMTLAYDNADTEEQLQTIEVYLETVIRWLLSEKEQQRRFFEYRQRELKK